MVLDEIECARAFDHDLAHMGMSKSQPFDESPGAHLMLVTDRKFPAAKAMIWRRVK